MKEMYSKLAEDLQVREVYSKLAEDLQVRKMYSKLAEDLQVRLSLIHVFSDGHWTIVTSFFFISHNTLLIHTLFFTDNCF